MAREDRIVLTLLNRGSDTKETTLSKQCRESPDTTSVYLRHDMPRQDVSE